MTLTIGTGPFGHQAGGVFNFSRDGPAHVLYFEDSPRRIRTRFAGETVADSRGAKLLHETGLLPVYYLPLDDVREDLLEPTRHTTHCPFKGDAAYWSVRVGDRVAENAVWWYPQPLDHAPPLAGYAAFRWDAMDAWYEEDEEVVVHPLDPYHRVDALRSSRRVRISAGGEVLAESDRPVTLFETGLPVRYYLPAEDVAMGRLEPSDTRTVCPYKGTTSAYWSVPAAGEAGRDAVWSYADPLPEAARIRGLVCFYNERVDVEVDGELQERPRTRWSP